MRDEFKAAFGAVHAPEELKAHTRRALQPLVRRRRARLRAAGLAVAACVLLLFGGCGLYFTPTSVISIDINPSLELSVNRFDRVIGAEGYNEDGKQLVQSLALTHRTYAQAVDRVLASKAVSDCLARDELLSIAVVESDARQGQEILDYLTACTARTPNAECYGVARQEVEQAHTVGLSYGKYRAYLELQALLPDITPDQVASMTMRQIRTLIAQQSGSTASAPGSGNVSPGPQSGNGDNRQNGAGQGNGRGWQGGRNAS